MAPVAVRNKTTRRYGPEDNGILMTPREFDRADFDDGWHFELINGVLIVSPIPSESEVDPNEELGYLLRDSKERHPLGSVLDATLPERYVRVGRNRRRPDRVIWVGLGRQPRRFKTPSIIAEFVSSRRRDRVRDYEVKREEYLAIRVKEYWVIDRFQRTLTVFFRSGRKRVFKENQSCKTDLLSGFELPLAHLFALADRWPEEETV